MSAAVGLDPATTRAILHAAQEEAQATDTECHTSAIDLSWAAKSCQESGQRQSAKAIEVAERNMASLARVQQLSQRALSNRGKGRLADILDRRLEEHQEKRCDYTQDVLAQEAKFSKILGNRGPLLSQLCQAIRLHMDVAGPSDPEACHLPSFLERARNAWRTAVIAYGNCHQLITSRTAYKARLDRSPLAERCKIQACFQYCQDTGWYPTEPRPRACSPTTAGCWAAADLWKTSRDHLRSLEAADFAGGSNLAILPPSAV
jgi:hypothetical protein